MLSSSGAGYKFAGVGGAAPRRAVSTGTVAVKFKAHEVYPHVYVGDMTAALDLKQLQERGITHVLTATNKMRPTHPTALHYLVLDFPDSSNQNLLAAFADAHSFIEEAVSKGGSVLIHW
jgi:protein-tyrosine phosphatase